MDVYLYHTIINEEDSVKKQLFKIGKNRKRRKIKGCFMVKKLTKNPTIKQKTNFEVCNYIIPKTLRDVVIIK